MSARRTAAVALLALAGWGATPEPSHAQAHVAAIRQGNAAAGDGRTDAAIEAYRRALAIAPESGVARFNLGTALAEAGQLDAAAEMLAVAVEHLADRDHKAAAHYNLANALARAGRLDDALAQYRASLRLRGAEDARFNYSLVWQWRQAQGEGPAPEEPLAPERVQEMRDRARALDVPVVRKPAPPAPPVVDR